MSNNLIFIGLLLGLASLAVGIGLGAVIPDRNRRGWLALSFALCDGLASLIGSLVGIDRLRSSLSSSLPWGEWLGPLAVACYGLYVLYLTWRCMNPANPTTNPTNPANPATNFGAARWLVFGLPICLSLDNLVAGVGTEASGMSAVLAALAFGVVSGGLALLGLGVGSALGARGRFRAGWLGGALLILVAGGLVLKEALVDLTANI
jgi:manganese efflux pump family protein